ncbi:MAG TPA: FlgO family outer membrane protein [Chitinophagaceae bacterium]|nr:FlgO family outer membrane protein [Chitinophagaceae bacterium]
MSQLRQLAAIMFTDIVGYTDMMQKNEQQAVTVIKHHRYVLEKNVTDHKGDVIEYYGDGSLCIFTSVTEALHCAMLVQQELSKEPAVPLRIGLHIGEILFDKGKVMGDGVNLASRIQALGQAGSILFSKEIFDKIRNHHEFKAVPLGQFELKNVAEPMEVFALANDGLTVPKKEEMAGRLKPAVVKKRISPRLKWGIILSATLLLIIAGIFIYNSFVRDKGFTGTEKSIAVLPFKNISNDTLQEYFSDGITEDIITQLSKIADLKVISNTSVTQYKNVSKNIKEIAEELQVASILEGSVRREGNQVRITAQLIDANTDQHIWANTYDRNITEVFAIQSEVAHEIANELNAKLTEEENKRIQKKATGNISAYEDYLQAKRSRGDSALIFLRSALQKDSTFALAWSSLSLIYSKMPVRDPTDRHYYISKSLDAALTAVNYGPDLSETHMILGDILKTITLNPNLSIKELNKSINLNPNNADAYVYMAYALMELGRFPEAEKNLLKAKQLDPLSRLMNFAWSRYYLYSRNGEKLGEFLREFNPTTINVDRSERRVSYYFLKEDLDSILIYGNRQHQPVELAIAMIKTNKTNQATMIIDSLRKASENDNASNIGIIYGWLGEKQKAIEYLDLAYRLYDYALISIKVNKLFDPLRNEEGFRKLLLKMGME